jgi:hypothetical protein
VALDAQWQCLEWWLLQLASAAASQKLFLRLVSLSTTLQIMPSIRAQFSSFVVLNTFIATTTKLKRNFQIP